MLTTSYWPADTSSPVEEKTVGDILREAAAEVPDQIALIAGMPQVTDRRRWTYAQMLDESERAAHALLGRFQPGERVPSGHLTSPNGSYWSSARPWPGSSSSPSTRLFARKNWNTYSSSLEHQASSSCLSFAATR